MSRIALEDLFPQISTVGGICSQPAEATFEEWHKK